MSIMVTGGTGLVGARVIRKLVEQGQKVVCFARNPPRAIPQHYQDRIAVFRGDITRFEQVMEAVKAHQVRRIIHLAAIMPPESEGYRGVMVNVLGASNVFEAARGESVERVVYASSITCHGVQETYGQRQVTEEDGYHPVSIYAMTKAMTEFMADNYADQHGLDTRCIRLSTVFGHGRVTGATAWLGQLISLPAVGQQVHVPVSPEDASCLIYAEDAAELFLRMTFSADLRFRVYISGGASATAGEVADLVKTYIPDARITFGDRHSPHVYLVDNSRIVSDLGYELPPLRVRVLDQINDARREAGLEDVSAPA